MQPSDSDTYRPPHEPLPRLFWRFLRFGLLAWGGPVAQIAMLRQELVEQEKWVSPAHFNRALALYQVLPGPEAHELCVYFGMVARGRMGGFLAGLGFMLPGLLLMLGACWLYTHAGLQSPATLAVFATVQAAVAALIVRGAWRIGQHALTHRILIPLAVGAAIAQAFAVPFGLTLLWAGLTALVLSQGRSVLALLLTAATVAAAVAWVVLLADGGPAPLAPQSPTSPGEAPSLLALLGSGLRTGLLTFGGAYTAIPFLQNDAVVRGGWMTNAQFLDGIALGGVLPAPLIIFGTFVGYLGGGFPGALAVTAGIFAPAFGFTLLAHHPLERLMHHPRARVLLDGITAGVVGLIATTALGLVATTVRDVPTALVFAAAAVFLFRSKARLAPVYALAGAALVGGVRHLVLPV